jgi:hypothetical protein
MIVNPTHRVLFALFLAAAIVAATPVASAQILYGSIVGSVTDASAAPIPAATIQIVQAATGETRKTETNSTGQYTFPTVNTGTYRLTVTKSGFQTFEVKEVMVSVNQVARVDAELRVGALTETVSVSAEAAQLQTESAEVRNEMTEKTIENVPVPFNRSFESLLITMPGFGVPENGSSSAANPTRGQVYTANGGQQTSNNTRIDGATSTNAWMAMYSGYTPGLDAIESVSVVSGTFDASQGLAGGASVNVHIKSGTNQLHGSAFGYNLSNWLSSRPFFQPAGTRIPKLVNNSDGGTIGGPIRKNKLFYFLSYDGHFVRQSATSYVTVPDALQRAGNFTASKTTIYDPNTGAADGTNRTAFPNNTIPTNRLDQIALKIQDYIPLPNQPQLGATGNYFANGNFGTNRHTNDAKLDYHITDKLSIADRFGWLKFNVENPVAFGVMGPALSGSGGRAGSIFGNVFNNTLSTTYTARPNLYFDGYFSLNRLDTNDQPPGMGTNQGLTTLGIPGTNGSSFNYSGWPWFNVSSYATYGISGDSSGGPLFYNDRTYQFAGNGTWLHGRHSIRFGSEISRQNLDHFEDSNDFAGRFNFTTGPTTLKQASGSATTSSQYNSYASFLLGLPNSIAKDSLPFGNLIEHIHVYNLYIQDQWHATAKLSLSFGTKWSYFPIGSRDDHGLERYNFATNQMLLCGIGPTPFDCGYQVSKHEFGPNLGIAYRVTNTLVVRTGFGINFDPAPLAYNRDMISNYPEILAFSQTAASSFGTTSSLAQGIPAIPQPVGLSSGVVTLPIGTGINTLPDHVKRDYAESWNLFLEKQLKWGMLAKAGYVGTRGVAIPNRVDQNYQSVGGGQASAPYFKLFGQTAALSLMTPANHTHYDALQTQLTRRFMGGMTFTASYTFSKNTGICCNQQADTSPNIIIPQYMFLARSIMSIDRTHHFSLSVVQELPFGKGKALLNHGVGSKIAGGWQLNGVFVRSSGKPFSISADGTSLNAAGNTQRANLVKPDVAVYGNIGPGQLYFDTSAFAQPTCACFGTVGYNTMRGPALANLDASLFRNFQINERWRVQFRAEGFNFTNTPYFGAPSGSITSSNFGQVTGVQGTAWREGLGQRMFRFGLKVQF